MGEYGDPDVPTRSPCADRTGDARRGVTVMVMTYISTANSPPPLPGDDAAARCPHMGPMAAALAFLLAAAAPTGTLTLDRADPVVAATIDGVPMRLRVALDQHGVVELNPAAAARLSALPFEPGRETEIGRVTLSGRVAPARLTIAGRTTAVTVSSYPRPCCDGVDGEIPLDLLSFADVRIIGPAGTARLVPRRMRMERRDDLGLFTRVATPGGPLLALFTLRHAATIATGAGASVLYRAGGGRFTGAVGTEARAFGIPRPVRSLALDRAVAVAGFPVATLLVRTTDFRGNTGLPPIPAAPDSADIRVTARARAPQRAISAVTLGSDVLGGCPVIHYAAATQLMTLFCA